MAFNPLQGYPDARKKLYAFYWVAGVVLGVIPVAFAAVPDAGIPTWSVVAMAVYGYIGVALGFTADQNTIPDEEE